MVRFSGSWASKSLGTYVIIQIQDIIRRRWQLVKFTLLFQCIGNKLAPVWGAFLLSLFFDYKHIGSIVLLELVINEQI